MFIRRGAPPAMGGTPRERLPVIALDEVLRPLLMRRGMQPPMLLIIAGVIGGLIGSGVLGRFVGPVVLAATCTLTKAWIAAGSPEAQRP